MRAIQCPPRVAPTRCAYAKRCRSFRRRIGVFAALGVDNRGVESLYTASWRAAAWRDGASAKPLTVHTVTEHPAMFFNGHVRVAAPVERVFFVVRSRKVPGCLTSELEERETWTAESLRTASSNGEGFGFFPREAVMEETSAVLRFKVFYIGRLRKRSEV